MGEAAVGQVSRKFREGVLKDERIKRIMAAILKKLNLLNGAT